MQTLTIKISNENNTPFLMELLQKFDFVADIKIQEEGKPLKPHSSKQLDDEMHSENLALLKERYKNIPITWGTGKPDISDFVGIWKDKDISTEQLRERAWKRDW